jgi:hypothetical protein
MRTNSNSDRYLLFDILFFLIDNPSLKGKG